MEHVRMRTFPLVAIPLLVLVSACRSAAEQQVPLPPQDVVVSSPDVTRIYFVRDERAGMQPRPVKVFDGDRPIGDLTTDTFLCWERPGGRTLGRARYEAVDFRRGEIEGLGDLDCASGRAYYFNVTVDYEQGKPSIQPLDPEDGRKLVASRKPAAGAK